eukprot:g11735.t1
MARRRSLPVQYHVSEAGEEVFDRVVRFIQLHGFCCVETRLVKEKDRLDHHASRGTHRERGLEHPPVGPKHQDGLLGEDGSARTLALEKHPEALQPTDQVLSDYAAGLMKSPSALDMGLQKLERTPSLLHEAGAPEEDPPAMSEVEAQAWLPIFLRPGSSQGEGSVGRSYALSCFLLGSETVGVARSPTAEQLDQWMLRHIEVAAEKGDPRRLCLCAGSAQPTAA